MSTILYSHSYPPSNVSISPKDSFSYPNKSDNQKLLKTNGNLNNNIDNISNSTKRKYKFSRNNNYNSNKNNDKIKNSIFSNLNSTNCSIPIITPVTVHCTHEKGFSKSQFNTRSTPININSNKLYNHNYFNSYNSTNTNLSPLNNNKLYLNDNLYSTSESPSMEDYMPTSELNNIKTQEIDDEMMSLFPLNKSGETIKTNSFDDISFQNIMKRTPMMEDNSNIINANEISEMNQMNNISELVKMEDVTLMNQLEQQKSNHTHNHYMENPFYYETTNLPTLDSKVKSSCCCYCGNY